MPKNYVLSTTFLYFYFRIISILTTACSKKWISGCCQTDDTFNIKFFVFKWYTNHVDFQLYDY